jgi:hypothetical protein
MTMYEFTIHAAFAISGLEFSEVRRLIARAFNDFEGYSLSRQRGIWRGDEECGFRISLVAWLTQGDAIYAATASLLRDLEEDTALVTVVALDKAIAVHANGDKKPAFDEPAATTPRPLTKVSGCDSCGSSLRNSTLTRDIIHENDCQAVRVLAQVEGRAKGQVKAADYKPVHGGYPGTVSRHSGAGYPDATPDATREVTYPDPTADTSVIVRLVQNGTTLESITEVFQSEDRAVLAYEAALDAIGGAYSDE